MTTGVWTCVELSDDALAHHGILGMKWGQRRFQNEDGTLTSAGKERYGVGNGSDRGLMGSAGGANSGKNIATKVGKFVADKPKEAIDVASKGIDAVKQAKAFIDKKTAEPYERVESLQKPTAEELSSMTNDQLKAYIERLSLEDKFNAALESHEKQAKGKDAVDKVLDDIGDILVVAGSAAGLALTIKQLASNG